MQTDTPPTQKDDILHEANAAESVMPNIEYVDAQHDDDEDDEEEVSFYGLSDETYNGIIAALHESDWLTVEQEILELEPSEIGQLLEKATRDDALELVQNLHSIMDSETYTYLGYDRLKTLFTVLNPREIGAIITDLETDDAIGLLQDLEEDDRREILRHVSTRNRALVEEGLSFPEESAGRLMQRNVTAVPEFWTVGKALDYLQAMGDALPYQLYDLFVVDPRHRVVGQIAVGQLLRASRGMKIRDLVEEDPPVVPADTDQEEVAALFRRKTMTSVAVVDDADRLIGTITVDDIVSVIDEEADEDLLLLAGVGDDDLTHGTMRTAWMRFRWLFVNMITALIAARIVGLFEATLDELVALAVLMPIVAGMGGNAGTQTLTVAVRALATKELSAANYWRVTLKESAVGLINGLLCASLVGLLAWLWFHDPKLGLVIASAMVLNIFMAGFVGTMVPIVLTRLKIDPAISSSIFVTTITDIVGFGSFLGLATIFLLR